MSTFLLVHGAWHGGWCWQRVAPLLEAQGHLVLTPNLPGHAEDPAAAATVTLENYSERIRTLAGAQPEPVVLVGHSMGGVAITQAAEDWPERFRALVYVCAFLPGNGESLATWSGQDSESLVNPSTTEARADGALHLRQDVVREAFYGQCGEEDVAFATSRLTPQPLGPCITPVTTSVERWGQVPRHYIECLRDRSITAETQREMVRRSPCQQVLSLDTDHSPFLSRPGELAEMLSIIARA